MAIIYFHIFPLNLIIENIAQQAPSSARWPILKALPTYERHQASAQATWSSNTTVLSFYNWVDEVPQGQHGMKTL